MRARLATLAVTGAGAFVAAAPAQAAFPGQNGKIAFGGAQSSAPAPANISVYVNPPAGSQLVAGDASGPAWSPDGARIAFTTFRDGNYEVYVMNADGTGQTRLTTDPSSEGGPAWSPDGGRIAFSSDRDGNAEVYVMNSDGSGQTRLTTDAAADGSPNWSPDASKIAFGCGGSICTMDSDGGARTALGSGGAPDWSPDGSKIAFHDYVEVPDPDPEDADGNGRTRLTFNGFCDVRDAGPNGTGYDAGCPPACGDGDETLFLRPGVFVP